MYQFIFNLWSNLASENASHSLTMFTIIGLVGIGSMIILSIYEKLTYKRGNWKNEKVTSLHRK
jgi:hypothetical protein